MQHPFELPQIDVATRWRHISSALTRTLDEQSYQLDETRLKRYRLLIDALTVGLVTPRQIARYESHISVLSTLVPGEVDILDFAALGIERASPTSKPGVPRTASPKPSNETLRRRGGSRAGSQNFANYRFRNLLCAGGYHLYRNEPVNHARS